MQFPKLAYPIAPRQEHSSDLPFVTFGALAEESRCVIFRVFYGAFKDTNAHRRQKRRGAESGLAEV